MAWKAGHSNNYQHCDKQGSRCSSFAPGALLQKQSILTAVPNGPSLHTSPSPTARVLRSNHTCPGLRSNPEVRLLLGRSKLWAGQPKQGRASNTQAAPITEKLPQIGQEGRNRVVSTSSLRQNA